MSTTNLFTGIAVVALLVTAGMAEPATPLRASHLRSYPYGPYANARAGLGKVLTTKDGGQIYGFDINQNGDDGVLASAQTIDDQGDLLVSMESFDQDTGKITSLFAKYKGLRNSYGVDGIFAGDVALVTHFVTPKGTIYAKRFYDEMNPVTAKKFTGPWTSPINDIDIEQWAENQTTTTGVVFAIELKKQDNPILVVTDVAANTVSNTIKLNPNLLSLGNGPQLGQYTAANEAILAASPDGGAVGGSPPVNVIVDLKTGKTKQFNGYNNGFYHAGDVNGEAVDPNTGVSVTDTELNAQVEFYDMNLHGRHRPDQQRLGHRGGPGQQALPRHRDLQCVRQRQRAGGLRRSGQFDRDDHGLQFRPRRACAGAQSFKAHGLAVLRPRRVLAASAVLLLSDGVTAVGGFFTLRESPWRSQSEDVLLQKRNDRARVSVDCKAALQTVLSFWLPNGIVLYPLGIPLAGVATNFAPWLSGRGVAPQNHRISPLDSVDQTYYQFGYNGALRQPFSAKIRCRLRPATVSPHARRCRDMQLVREVCAGEMLARRSCYSLLFLFPVKFPASREFDLGTFRREIPCSVDRDQEAAWRGASSDASSRVIPWSRPKSLSLR